MKKHCQKVKAEQTIETAVEDASKEAMTQGKDIAQKTVILACGSLSYLGEVQRIVLNNRAEDEEVLSLQTLELDRTADTLVYRVFSHTLFIKGRMSAG